MPIRHPECHGTKRVGWMTQSDCSVESSGGDRLKPKSRLKTLDDPQTTWRQHDHIALFAASQTGWPQECDRDGRQSDTGPRARPDTQTKGAASLNGADTMHRMGSIKVRKSGCMRGAGRGVAFPSCLHARQPTARALLALVASHLERSAGVNMRPRSAHRKAK